MQAAVFARCPQFTVLLLILFARLGACAVGDRLTASELRIVVWERQQEKTMTKTRKETPLFERAAIGAQAQVTDLVYDAKLMAGLLPDPRDGIDKDELPISFILKKGRDRADAKALKESHSTTTNGPALPVHAKK